MNKWLGFSLTPPLRICDSEEEHEEELRHDGSDVWGYDINLDHHHHHQHDEVPKVEDLLSNSHQTEYPLTNNQTNVNSTTVVNRLNPPGYLLHEQTVVTPQYPNLDPNLTHDYGGFERVGSVSVFKSWLGQGTPTFQLSSTYVTEEGGTSNNISHFSNEEIGYNTNGSMLSLALSHGACSDLINETNASVVPVEEPVKIDEKRKRLTGKSQVKDLVPRKSVDSFGQRTSQYRGVTRHRWTGRYEAHLWDNSCKKEGQTRKGRQVYLGGYDDEKKAARAYDLAALKYWGPTTHLNFPLSNYEKEIEELNNMNRQEFVAMLRRNSSGFSRGASIYRGVTRHHQHGRWQARIGRVAGNKDLYLGTYSTQEEAAEAYDIAAIKFRGLNAVTNFDINRYDVKRICSSSTIFNSDQANRSPTSSGSGQ
ncbi:unnamed protein product [Arabidopsis lyrata]|uniref:AP2-like ethylene-responsive transcription factor AIL1 n=1 Tax=Arabidopsis lyrata subsp. lyrata TaxID=81972 RepID=UPI000A29CD55|nr:AP2-like ethylene-responsive transcription factor AIL1 [Arabidopsis lyrata subsp. lyrata]CAH8257954.1 unnamed protein product [Arabidopsis lyrata]|eukprot:XP_020891434.1 AP2-like ethylene-responsive transcription factor AIL1 [Arabidopsis lyrata subsp. lyrata]